VTVTNPNRISERGEMKARINARIATVAVIALVVITAHYTSSRAEQTSAASRSVWDGVYTEGQAKRGQAFYTQECSSCHGTDLAGADEVPALSGPAFLANWEGLTVGDLFERVRISMPPNKQGRLTRQQIADILSHVLKANSFPTGKTELDPKTEVQKQIRIEATKPDSKSGTY